VGTMINSYQGMSVRTRFGLAAGLALILVGTVAALWWVFSPTDRLLFGNLRETDAAEIAAALNEWKVPHRFSEHGDGILVDAGQIHAVRMRLVSAGIPKGGHVGYELFDDNEFGVTEFAQRINYQRALQGELERTIAAIPGVQNVRVHLTIRRPGLFLAEEADSKASVAVALTPGSSLERRQVTGIRNLVASAVEGLKPEAVVVVGPSGLQLGGSASLEEGGAVSEQSDTARELAAELQTKIAQLLTDALQGQRATVSVNVRMNFDRIRKTSERLLAQPGSDQGVVVRRSSNGAQPREAGGGGVLLNEQVEYAHGTEREEVTRSAGTIERISVAVMLPAGVSTDEQERLRPLVAAAAGIDVTRGDTLEVAIARASEARQSAVPLIASEVERNSANDSAIGSQASKRFAVGIMGLSLAWALGLAMGLLAMALRRRKPLMLNAEQSEVAAIKVRAWLADGAA
jgi:flagellar M-ring protein FliF